ncbi:MAG: RsmB/NOP family class I SAM-dependent RNA methyltransferase [Rhodocyclaceae bacterium]|jgi:16S rRNA (cytosine967-C5)-methyltransferase|nr:RsmB/NOP family class I SAM-dependent RNA methyltransferase [Rhodocyclaceae bacterium]
MNTISRSLLEQAISVTGQLLQFRQPADAVLSAFFRAQRSGPRERAFIAEAAYAVLRRQRSLAAWAGPECTAKQLVLAALVRHCGVSLRMLEGALPKRDADWLMELKARPEPLLSPAEQADLPDWLIERLRGQMDETEFLDLARALNQPAPLDLRVNTLKADRDAVLARFAQEGIAAAACPFAPAGIRLAGKPPLNRHPLFLDGSIEVQDEGSQLLGYLLQPKRGEMVVDFCAGAGGKTLLLGALMRSTGRLYAFDVSEKRLAKLKPRLARSGLSNVHPAVIAHENDTHVKRLAGKCDRVLVDAPCSGLGTLRRNPDLKWRQTPQSVAELTQKQAAILAAAAKLLKPGGRLVYATCSLLPEENGQIVDAFLAAYPGFVRRAAGDVLAAQGIRPGLAGDDLQLLPHRHDTDGFYAAVLERCA